MVENSAHRSRAIFVLSVPRSGSSAVAGALHAMGVNMGEGYLQVKDELNPKGYYEDLRWQMLSKMIAGTRYSTRVGAPNEDLTIKYRRLIRECASAPLWGVKGPRLAFLFEHVWKLVEGEGVETRVIVVHRNLEDVVRSFQRHTQIAYRGQFEMTHAEAREKISSWLDALEGQLVKYTGPVFEVGYNQLMEEPVTELLYLHDFCYEGLQVEGHRRIITPALNWLDPELRHYGHRPTDDGSSDGGKSGQRGARSGWVRKRPCTGCRGRKSNRVDAKREPSPA